MLPMVWNKANIYNACDYYPSYTLSNLSVDVANDSRKMMDFKEPSNPNFLFAVTHFSTIIAPYLCSIHKQIGTARLHVVIVPSSKARCLSTGLRLLLSQLKTPPIVTEVNYLVRQYDVPKAHRGGGRSMQKHLNSVKVECIPHKNTPVLLLDDVTTSGNSMFACEQILNKAGVLDVYKLAIGKSVK